MENDGLFLMAQSAKPSTPSKSQPTIVAYNEAGRTPLPESGALANLCAGARLIATGDPAALRAALAPSLLHPGPMAVLTNTLNPETLTWIHGDARKANPNAVVILLVDKVHAEYTKALGGREHDLVDHIIAVRHDADTAPSADRQSSPSTQSCQWSNMDLRATLQKLIRRDLFGVAKYLRTGARFATFPVTSSKDRDPLHNETANFALACGLSQSVAMAAKQIVQEMLLNAIYDAPHAAGRHEVKERSGRPVDLAPQDHGRLELGFDGEILAVSVWDPFGLFKRDIFFTYARKALNRANSEEIIDSKIEGAGLGLMTVYLRSHGLICNVDPGRGTEVMALIDTRTKVRDFEKIPRSIHYFKTSEIN